MQRIETVDHEIRLMHRSNAQKENLRRHIEQLYQHVHEAEHSIESGCASWPLFRPVLTSVLQCSCS